MFTALLFVSHLKSAHAVIPFPRPTRICASALVAPGRPMAADRSRVHSPAQTADLVKDAKLEDFRLDARLTNVRATTDHQGRSRLLGELGGYAVFLKSYFPWDETVELNGQRVSRIRREAIFLKILDDLELGPRFFGIATVKQRPTLVMENVSDAIFFKKGQSLFPPPRLPTNVKPVVRGQLEYLVETIHQHGIIPYDLQVLITDAGRVVVIDPALYILYDEEGRNWRLPHTWFTDDALQKLFSSAGT